MSKRIFNEIRASRAREGRAAALGAQLSGGARGGRACARTANWIAVPQEHEEDEPRFEHHPAATIPKLSMDGAKLEIVAGTAYGQRSPVGVLSPTLYVHALLQAGATLDVDDGQNARFPKVPGDEHEFTPLPELLNPTKTTS